MIVFTNTAMSNVFRSPSPPIKSSGTQTPVAGVVDNRHLPANFQQQDNSIIPTSYWSYTLTLRQTSRIDQRKYFNEIKRRIKDRYGHNRYKVIKSRSRELMIIKDGDREIFACSINNHAIRCAYLEIYSVDFNIEAFLSIAGNWSERTQAISSPEHLD